MDCRSTADASARPFRCASVGCDECPSWPGSFDWHVCLRPRAGDSTGNTRGPQVKLGKRTVGGVLYLAVELPPARRRRSTRIINMTPSKPRIHPTWSLCDLLYQLL